MRFQNITLSMFDKGGNDFPQLKGRAAEIRHLGRALFNVFVTYMSADNREHRFIKMGLEASVRMEDILDSTVGQYTLSGNEYSEFVDAAFAFLGAQTALGNIFHPRAIFLFHTTIKSHYLLHCALLSCYIHPRFGWTYGNESFMQVGRKLVSACQRGTRPQLVGSKVMKKYIDGLAFALMRHQIWA